MKMYSFPDLGYVKPMVIKRQILDKKPTCKVRKMMKLSSVLSKITILQN